MKNILLLLTVPLLVGTLGAQDFQGRAVYMSKTKIEFDLEGRNIPEARKKEIMERIKGMSERTYELDFDRTGSLYQEQARLETPGTGAGRGMRFSMMGGEGVMYKDVQKKSFVNQTELFGKVFLITDSLEQWNWKLGSETKKIGNYTCYKATTVRQPDTTMRNTFRRIARRNQQEPEVQKDSVGKDSTTRSDNQGNSLLARLEEEPKEQLITAWFTPDIPVSQGPGPYWGLPGLILEVNDGRTVILCTQILLNPEQKKAIEAPGKGKEVTQEEYDRIRAEKMEEMSERWRSGNRRGQGGGFRIGG